MIAYIGGRTYVQVQKISAYGQPLWDICPTSVNKAYSNSVYNVVDLIVSHNFIRNT